MPDNTVSKTVSFLELTENDTFLGPIGSGLLHHGLVVVHVERLPNGFDGLQTNFLQRLKQLTMNEKEALLQNFRIVPCICFFRALQYFLCSIKIVENVEQLLYDQDFAQLDQARLFLLRTSAIVLIFGSQSKKLILCGLKFLTKLLNVRPLFLRFLLQIRLFVDGRFSIIFLFQSVSLRSI